MLRTPNRLCARDGVFALADDSLTGARLVLLEDRDGDGAACGAGEARVFYEAAAATAPAAPKDPEALCMPAEGVFLVGDGTDGRVYRMEDLDGDGAARTADEITVLYAPPDGEPLPRWSCLALRGDGVLAADRARGRVLLLRDADGDGAVSPSEASVFCGASPSSPLLVEPRDLWVESDGGVWIIDNGTNMLYRAADRNGDGDALDAGELLVVLRSGAALSQPTALAVVEGARGDAPALDGLSAHSGDAAGGDIVVITGSGFTPGTMVFFGDAAAKVQYESAEMLRAVTPPGSGTVGVTAAGLAGLAFLADAWEYRGAALAVTAIEPREGPAAGGTHVAFSGAGLAAASVWFDGIPAQIVSATEATLVAAAPPHAPGEVIVLVADGRTEVTLAFTYIGGAVFVRGDVDADGKHLINDAILILSKLFAGGAVPACLDRADVNDDGAVNIADAICLLGYLFAGNAAPPPPFPEPGVDPTPDTLQCP
ncbi:MAG TPA: hypothetical protein DCM87_15700 [Planctomycetes bacterium]|nr:hypothetical protein [Planctomycetota bacterium]